MDRRAIEQLAEGIRAEGEEIVEVLGIEHMGPALHPQYATDFFVKCFARHLGILIVVKSPEQWASIKQLFGCGETVFYDNII